ncbi:hypothetical protein EG329_011715 [Mollisiaceae sp. DMI_Dod_QoI]|nr:hypothetical protein EG329_011715 [Helotiales sp. DMI_Dod_QoI]
MTSLPPSPTLQLKFADLHLSPLDHCTQPWKNQRDQKQDQAPESSQQHKFHCFSQLPTELRIKIYALSLPGPRLVPIHYLSPAKSLSPCPSPPRFTSPYLPHKRICSSTSLLTASQINERKKEWIGCTSPAAIPALLHVCHESRALAMQYYTLSFRLAGPEDMFKEKVWFSNNSSPHPNVNSSLTSNPGFSATTEGLVLRQKEREQDILYFPSVPGYLASFKHWTHILSILPHSSFHHVRRLAVHEDLFLEERKRRSSQDSGLGWESTDSAWGSGGSVWGNGENRGNGMTEGNGRERWSEGADTVVEERLRDFWRDVKRRLPSVREVVIVGEGREEDVLSLSSFSTSSSSSRFTSYFSPSWVFHSSPWDRNGSSGETGREELLCMTTNSGTGNGMMICRRGDTEGGETFEDKVARILSEFELELESAPDCGLASNFDAESGRKWKAPRWRVLSAGCSRGGSGASSPL